MQALCIIVYLYGQTIDAIDGHRCQCHKQFSGLMENNNTAQIQGQQFLAVRLNLHMLTSLSKILYAMVRRSSLKQNFIVQV